jgi:hypothetical protein
MAATRDTRHGRGVHHALCASVHVPPAVLSFIADDRRELGTGWNLGVNLTREPVESPPQKPSPDPYLRRRPHTSLIHHSYPPRTIPTGLKSAHNPPKRPITRSFRLIPSLHPAIPCHTPSYPAIPAIPAHSASQSPEWFDRKKKLQVGWRLKRQGFFFHD